MAQSRNSQNSVISTTTTNQVGINQGMQYIIPITNLKPQIQNVYWSQGMPTSYLTQSNQEQSTVLAQNLFGLTSLQPKIPSSTETITDTNLATKRKNPANLKLNEKSSRIRKTKNVNKFSKEVLKQLLRNQTQKIAELQKELEQKNIQMIEAQQKIRLLEEENSKLKNNQQSFENTVDEINHFPFAAETLAIIQSPIIMVNDDVSSAKITNVPTDQIQEIPVEPELEQSSQTNIKTNDTAQIPLNAKVEETFETFSNWANFFANPEEPRNPDSIIPNEFWLLLNKYNPQ